MSKTSGQEETPLPGNYRQLLEGRVVSWNELVRDKAAFHPNTIRANVADYNLMFAMWRDIYIGRIKAYGRAGHLPELFDLKPLDDDVFLTATDILEATERLNTKSVKATGRFINEVPKRFDAIVRALLKCNDYSPSVENGKLVQTNAALDCVKPGPDGKIDKKKKKFSL